MKFFTKIFTDRFSKFAGGNGNHKILKISFDFTLLIIREFDILGSSIVSREYDLQIGIPGEECFAIAECEDCSRRIFADSGEFFELLLVSREYSGMFTTHDIRSFEEIASSGVVSESLIVREELIIVGSCKMLDGRIFAQYPLIKRYHTICLGLLEENLSEPDMVDSRCKIIDSKFRSCMSIHSF